MTQVPPKQNSVLMLKVTRRIACYSCMRVLASAHLLELLNPLLSESTALSKR